MLRKITHISIVPLLLIATMGMTVNLHFCQQHLYDIGVFDAAKSCCEVPASDKQNDHHHCTPIELPEDHCLDDQIQLPPVDDYLASSGLEINNEHLLQMVLFETTPVLADISIQHAPGSSEHFTTSASPPGRYDIRIRLQSFLL